MSAQEATVPATPTQEALWWVHHRVANKSVYALTWRMALGADVDPDALGVAWQSVVDRHDSLRASLRRHDDELLMVVESEVAAVFEHLVVDDPEAVPATLLPLIAEELHERPFSLDRAPLIRLTLVEVGDAAELVLTSHHTVADGWAMQLVLNDLSTAYEFAKRGEPPTFTAEAESFQAYAQQTSTAVRPGRWSKSIDFWREALADVSVTTLAADRERYTGSGAPGTILRFGFSGSAVDGLGVLSQLAQTTPFTVVLGAMQIVLSRGGPLDDVAVGVISANRMTRRDQAVVGYLANLCVVRCEARDDDTVADAIARTRDGMWNVLAHQAVPFPTVFGALTEADKSALRDSTAIIFTYFGSIGGGLSLGDVPLRLQKSPNRASRTDIAIGLFEDGDRYLVEVEYNTARYEQSTVLAFLHDLDEVLAAGGRDPNRRMDQITVRSRSAVALTHVEPVVPEPPSEAGSMALDAVLLDQVAKVWTDLLGVPPRSVDEDFLAAGGHSLKVLALATAVEAETGRGFDVVTWLNTPTPRRIVELIVGVDPGTAGASTVVTLRAGSGLHLHLIHGAGGGPQDYRALLRVLPPDWRVTASQERTPLDTVASMAERYRSDLDAQEMSPDILGGWSLGGLIAYEMVIGWTGPPPALVLLDSVPPVGYDLGDDATSQLRDQFVATVCSTLGIPADGPPPRAMRGDRELELRALAAYLTATCGEPVGASALIAGEETYRRHTLAGASYVTTGVVSSPTLLVAAELTEAQIDQWGERLSSRPDQLRVDTDHYGVLRVPAVDEIAAALRTMAATPQPALTPPRPVGGEYVSSMIDVVSVV